VHVIETMVSINGHKALVVSHSMGGNLWHYFQQWVMHRIHPNWIHDHIYSEVMISAPMLGLPKAYYSLLMGDNRDFAAMGKGFAALIEYFFGPMTRRRLWRSCSSLSMILPLGGESVWGEQLTGRPLVQIGDVSLNVTAAIDLLAKAGDVPPDLQRISDWLTDGLRRSQPEVSPSLRFTELPEHLWGNALATVLPFAPQMRKYAFYGVGVDTDVAAVLQETGDDSAQPRYTIHREATKDRGFHYGDGDYSVPLHSLGLMCLEGWKDSRRNPAQMPCTVREYKDNPIKAGSKVSSILDAAKAAGEVVGAQTIQAILSGGYSRGGQPSGDHIDILGNELMLEDLLRVANGEEVGEQVVSDIRDFAQRWRQSE